MNDPLPKTTQPIGSGTLDGGQPRAGATGTQVVDWQPAGASAPAMNQSPPQQPGQPPGQHPGQHHPGSGAPGRDGELQQSPKTMFEFTGNAAPVSRGQGGRNGTFVGSALDLGSEHRSERRESNLNSGLPMWLFALIALVLGGGVYAWLTMGATQTVESTDVPAAAAAVAAIPDETADAKAAVAAGSSGGPEADDATPDDAGTGDAKADDAGTGDAKADDAKADDTKADDTKADDTKADDAPAKPAAAPKADPKPGGTTKKKKKAVTKKKKKVATKKKKKSLKSGKPPRDPLKNLPKPPG